MTQSVLGMTETLERQRSAFIAGGRPSTKLRRDRLQRAISMLLQNQDTIVEAVRSDFGHRVPLATKAAEILTPVGSLGNAAAQLDQWKQPETRTLAPERQAGSRGGPNLAPLSTASSPCLTFRSARMTRNQYMPWACAQSSFAPIQFGNAAIAYIAYSYRQQFPRLTSPARRRRRSRRAPPRYRRASTNSHAQSG